MPHRRPLARLGSAVATMALALSLVPAAAAGQAAPLIDGWRPAPGPEPVVLTIESFASVTPRSAAASRARAIAAPAGSPNACNDRKRSFIGGRWRETYAWTYRARTTPAGMSRAAAIRTLKRAVRNITDARNDCGRPDRVSARAVYRGTSDRKPGPTARGTCAPMDGHNAVGFGRLPSGIAGLTCIWSRGDQIVEADIKLDKRARWATSLASCRFASMLQAVATHEFGHAFGLGHVSEARHGRLTMSERLDGYCQNGESTLGLGDLLGLEKLY